MSPSSRLDRRLGRGDAVLIGLGSMIGAGVFSVFAPAARVAGSGLIVGLAIAAAVALANATSSAQLAGVYPFSGGTYVYGRERLGPTWGFLAGWGFIAGKTASCAAMALTFASYVAPGSGRAPAVVAVAGITALNLAGVHRTARATQIVVALVLGSLVAIVLTGAFAPATDAARLGSVADLEPLGILRSAGLLFFAFAGYARLATLGEEVVEPHRTIPWAIPVALGLALAVYATVGVTALAALGPTRLGHSTAPLADVAGSGGAEWAAPVATAGAALASLGALLSLLAGVSRTVFAMAANQDLPKRLAAVHPRSKVPHRAEIVVAALVVLVVIAFGEVSDAIGFSSFTVLGYYAITNASCWTLQREQRHWPRSLSAAGLGGCVLLASSLPLSSVLGGIAVFAAGAVVAIAVARSR
jgi:APA family basic amino acid/polyamine antiporter